MIGHPLITLVVFQIRAHVRLYAVFDQPMLVRSALFLSVQNGHCCVLFLR